MNAQNPCPTMNQRHWRRRHSHTKALKQFLESRENPNSVEHLQQKQSNRESAEPSWQLWLKTLCYLIINCNNFLNCFLLPAPGKVHSPPAGPKKLRYLSPEGTFRKIWSILPTLTPFNLLLQNFPGPLAFRITIYMVLAPAGQLFIKIWPQGREIFKILCQNFWKMRMHFWIEFAAVALRQRKQSPSLRAISVSTSQIAVSARLETAVIPICSF